MKQMFIPHDCTVMLVDENKNSVGRVDFTADQVQIVDGNIRLPQFSISANRICRAEALVVFYGPMLLVCEVGTGGNGEITLDCRQILQNDVLSFTGLSLQLDPAMQ